MYVPQHFRLSDEHVVRFLGTPRVANLVTVHDDGPRATLTPMFVDERDGERVCCAHLVRNNPQATTPIVGPGLFIVDIADAYVSPTWYATNDVVPTVPTWDYLTIHLTGEVTIVENPAAALAVARELTRRMGEEQVTQCVGQEKLERMARAIVCVELRPMQIEGKAKMSQNRHPDDLYSLLAEFERQGETELANYLRTVSIPHAEARFALIDENRALATPARGRRSSIRTATEPL